MSSEDADIISADDSQDNSTVTGGSSTSSSADTFGTVKQSLTESVSADNPPGQSRTLEPSSSVMAEIKSDTLSSFIDKFENLIREFYRLKGELSDVQSARMLLSAIPSLSIKMKEYIHNTVVPLTREGVATYLRKYEERHGWTCSAIREANAVSIRPNKKVSGECTPDECVDKRLAFLAKICGKSGGGNLNSSTPITQESSVRGAKKVFDSSVNNASASMAFLSLNVEFTEDVKDNSSITSVSASPSEFDEDPDIDASGAAMTPWSICNTVEKIIQRLSALHLSCRLRTGF
ncbi:uncharacterized protein MELLADRAFT_111402 [Melampsora larici-populina 98AG31]|uniref:Uncharacterized protein n=1 Tax=Melampsora larici-populina (strain 98AG31 / pathotype 3-4-7) TaxID=747676 RepID=F4S332_MELLP|nr:uncharacterized protein MELLADRAFT_111402 [Melampsora larici-populina 98AG31]EGG00976.1 hypothetical protein MELLADRAFT_111402 [Melampsora larici-populina 98AG31]